TPAAPTRRPGGWSVRSAGRRVVTKPEPRGGLPCAGERERGRTYRSWQTVARAWSAALPMRPDRACNPPRGVPKLVLFDFLLFGSPYSLAARRWLMPSHRICGMSCVFVLLTSALLGCAKVTSVTPDDAENPREPPWFVALERRCGLDFVHDAGAVNDRYFMPQITGSGVALFDFNNDGLLDIYLVQNGGPG